MFLVVLSKPAPIYPTWLGRRTLAAVDACLWPAVWAWIIVAHVPARGLTIRWLCALLVLIACRRLWRALSDNEHYGFSTVRWGKALIGVWVFGYALKLLSQVPI
jgi:hypothetical protein